MKRITVILAVVSLLALCHISQAADLQAGWYAKISSVDIYSYDDQYHLPYLRGGGWFTEPTGLHYPFDVTDEGYQTDSLRRITVVQDTVAGPDQSLTLSLWVGVGYSEIAFLNIHWHSNYDASQMVLEFWQEWNDGSKHLLWSQGQSGEQFGDKVIDGSLLANGEYRFKVNVVPEPSSLTGLILALPVLVGFARRRK